MHDPNPRDIDPERLRGIIAGEDQGFQTGDHTLYQDPATGLWTNRPQGRSNKVGADLPLLPDLETATANLDNLSAMFASPDKYGAAAILQLIDYLSRDGGRLQDPGGSAYHRRLEDG